jgi:hypothetical protein
MTKNIATPRIENPFSDSKFMPQKKIADAISEASVVRKI